MVFRQGCFLAFEAGFDRTNSFLVQHNGSLNNFDGWFRKLTVAPQISAGRKFFSRPALRRFSTYASWSTGFHGRIGRISFGDRNSGVTYGVQAETWW